MPSLKLVGFLLSSCLFLIKNNKDMLHEILDLLVIGALLLSGLGLTLSIIALVLPRFRHRDRFMYFGARVLVGSVIVALISLVLARHAI